MVIITKPPPTAADVWTYATRTLTAITGTPRSDLLGSDEPISTSTVTRLANLDNLDALISSRATPADIEMARARLLRFFPTNLKLIRRFDAETWTLSQTPDAVNDVLSARAHELMLDTSASTTSGRRYATHDSGALYSRIIMRAHLMEDGGGTVMLSLWDSADNAYELFYNSGRVTDDILIIKNVAGAVTILGSEAVDLTGEQELYFLFDGANGILMCVRDDVTRIVVSDTSFASFRYVGLATDAYGKVARLRSLIVGYE